LLSAALRHEEVIIAAAQTLRVVAANAGPGVVYSAPAAVGIEKLTDRFEDMVLLVSQHAISKGNFGESLLSLLVSQPEILSEPLDVPSRNFNAFVAATIRRTLRAVEQHTERASVGFLFTVRLLFTVVGRAHRLLNCSSNEEATLILYADSSLKQSVIGRALQIN